MWLFHYKSIHWRKFKIKKFLLHNSRKVHFRKPLGYLLWHVYRYNNNELLSFVQVYFVFSRSDRSSYIGELPGMYWCPGTVHQQTWQNPCALSWHYHQHNPPQVIIPLIFLVIVNILIFCVLINPEVSMGFLTVFQTNTTNTRAP